MHTISKSEFSLNIPDNNQARVVIIGGGFGGLKLARKLISHDLQVVLLDRNNYHVFQPLLYQVATAGLEPDAISGPMRQHIEERENFYFRMQRVKSIDPDKKLIRTEIGDLAFDYLIIASGSITNYFGNDKIAKSAYPLKQLPHALDLRSHILENFENAVLTNDEDERALLMTMVVVGGGPTGVEVAGALGELKNKVLPKDFPELNFDQMHIYLVEGNDKLLGGMSVTSSNKALFYLKKLGANVILKKFVKSFENNMVTFSDGTKVPTNTLVWAAGVKGNIIPGMPESSVSHSRYLMNEFCQVYGYENIFAVGDVGMIKSTELPNGHPMVAPVAIQQADLLAKNLIRMRERKALRPFVYVDKGAMATVGRNKAVVDLPGKLRFSGFMAWLMWMVVHLLSIIGLRNKAIIFANWIWNYFTYDRGNRLIIKRFQQKVGLKKKKEDTEDDEHH